MVDVWKGHRRESPRDGLEFFFLPSSPSTLGSSAPLTARTSPFTFGRDNDPPPLQPPLPRRQQQTRDSLPPVPLRRHEQHRHRRGRRHVRAAASLSDGLSYELRPLHYKNLSRLRSSVVLRRPPYKSKPSNRRTEVWWGRLHQNQSNNRAGLGGGDWPVGSPAAGVWEGGSSPFAPVREGSLRPQFLWNQGCSPFSWPWAFLGSGSLLLTFVIKTARKLARQSHGKKNQMEWRAR